MCVLDGVFMRSSFVAGSLAATLLLVHNAAGAAVSTVGEVDGERTVVTGRVSSYAWVLNDGDVNNEKGKEGSDLVLKLYGSKVGYRDYGYVDVGNDLHRSLAKGLNTWGAGYDAALSVGLRTGSDKFGNVYGADFTLSVPVGAAGGSVLHSLSGQGSRIFAKTMLGEFSLGYQEGVESSMKVNVLGKIAGETGAAWGRYTRYFQRYTGGVPFHMHPGLYSENLLRTDGSWERVHGYSAKFRDVFNSIPSRVSYVSPKVKGVNIGFSYALTPGANNIYRGPEFEVAEVIGDCRAGYIGESVCKGRKVLALGTPRFDAKPGYSNVLSAALRYELGKARRRMAVVFSGEYARSGRLEDVLPMDYSYKGAGWLVEYNDLAAVSTGAEAHWGGVRGAFAVGLLGKSGKPKSYVKMDGKGVVTEGSRIRVPYAKQQGHSFYLVSSLSYTDGPVTASVGYYVSRLNYNPLRYVPRYEESGDFISPFDGVNELHDVVVGLGYNVYRKGSANLEMFLNCHFYTTKQYYRKYLLQSRSGEFHLKGRGTTKSSGVVALTGLRFTF
ncbi:hypothetical protein ANPL_01720 [Anaplasma platys]|uniref:Porin domain-containing protein n=2 Tax=Anaplasma platys TaxID=949 RepID=A0A858PY07_9RICK|nr:hypothetical protein ANPL_01720 [Anaplasma platys]